MSERRRGLRRTRIRTLRPGEPLPEGEPRRYPNDRGYVRLRWKVGPAEYVEVYEHRLVAGLPDAEVHHRDGDKANNDRDNLLPLDKREHATHHGEQNTLRSKRMTLWGGLRSQGAYEKHQRALARRAERQRFAREIVDLYRSGLTTVEVAERVGRDSSVISRVLRASGVVARQHGGGKRKRSDVRPRVRQIVQARARMRCEVCGRDLTWCGGQVHHRRPRAMGGSRLAGTNTPPNLLFVCADCHGRIERNRTEAYANGWLVPQSAAPERAAVLVDQESRWVYLSRTGEYMDVPPSEADSA